MEQHAVRNLALFIVSIWTLVTPTARAAPQKLLSTPEVLVRIEQAATPDTRVAPKAEPVQLLADIRDFRAQVAGLAPAEAVTRWFELYERAGKIDLAAAQADFGAYDLDTMQVVGADSMFASLPPPPTWPALRQEASRRAASAPKDREALALRFLTEILTKDRESADRTLNELDIVFAGLSPDEREIAVMALSSARSKLVRAYGTPSEIAGAFDTMLRGPATPYGSLEVPDLVGLAGEKAATDLLVKAVSSPHTLRLEGGDATRGLARRIALENIERMRVPQWDLVDSIDSARLYEAIEKRFDPVAAAAVAPAQDDARENLRADYQKRAASAWYFLASVVDGRQREAERALGAISSDSEAYVPREAVDALRKLGQEEALYRFLGAQLAARPAIRAWDLYIREAAFAGHSADALALIDKILKRPDLPEFLAADLRLRRVSALLAADQLDPAGKELRALLAAPPARGEMTLKLRTDAALKAAAVGRLTKQRSLGDLGLQFALAAERVMPANEDRDPNLPDHTRSLWREMRRSGRDADVQSLAIELLATRSSRSGFQSLGNYVMPSEVQAMAELAGIWSAAGRHDDVMRLLDESTRWGVVDAGPLLTTVDSLDLPLGVMAARALAARGDSTAALRVARATISQLPGKDASYELLARLDPAALSTLDALYARDEFEERPLIWKASVQLAAGALPEAEATVRRAITVDPSDGEQGPDDRMRAYSVLAEILKRKGDAQGAATYIKAIDAIRLSEKADTFHEAGMYERAFSGYRQALNQFADAYCIQSRLAVQLYNQGRRTEALEHYRRAYELMPDSFGRVESHCFGCESVFQGPEAQSIADRVFTDAIRKAPAKAQAYYLLAYLREQQRRPGEALQPLRQAVSLDPRYLNAWVRLNELGEHTYVAPDELDIARLKMLELDPLRRHSHYSVEQVTDLTALWRGAERANQAVIAAQPLRDGVYPLKASAQSVTGAREALPPEMRDQMEVLDQFRALQPGMNGFKTDARAVLGQHQFVESTKLLIGMKGEMNY